MVFKEPSFEEYKTATDWARFKYKYGIIVLILCWLCLLFVIYYMVVNGTAIASNPLVYGADKFNVTCSCERNYDNFKFHVNGSGLWKDKGFGYYYIEPLNLSNISY